MKAKDVGYVAKVLGNITVLLNELVGSGRIDDDKYLTKVLMEKRDDLGKIKKELEEKIVEIKGTS